MDNTRNPRPPEKDAPDAFEPAGGIVSKPPAPEQGEQPTEGDTR